MENKSSAITTVDENGVEYSTFMRDGKLFTRRLERNGTHRMSYTRLYSKWKSMRRRCNNPNDPKYQWYGGKGVKVCPEWDRPFGGFEMFRDWALSNGYQDDLTIDRIDPNKGYFPENCRWITRAENTRRAAIKPHKIEWTYYAYSKEKNELVIFFRTRDFEKCSGVDFRRVSDGCNNPNKTYHGWKFRRIPYNEYDTSEGQETIPDFGSTPEDELPVEVQITLIRKG